VIRALLLAAAVSAIALGDARADYDFSWGATTVDREFNKSMGEARAKLLELGDPRRYRERRNLAHEAYVKLAGALVRRPRDTEANYLAAELIYHWELYETGHRTEWLDRGIDHYSKYLANKPTDTRVRSALFNRSLLYSKRALGQKDFVADFRRAIADYDRQLAMLDDDTTDAGQRGDLATILSNAAELHMGIGELDRAIEQYVQSLEIEPRALYRFGLAVALDRDGQRLRAAEVMHEAINGDSVNAEGVCELDREGVFFVPDGDKSYYLALRAETLGKYAEARRHYQVFLNKLGDGRYARVARANMAALRGKRDSWKPSAKDCQ
jgi:tetratricopeptide (TPR) repeat protein